MNNFLKIFSCCFIVKGTSRSSVYDIQRQQLYFIPNSLYNLIDKSTNSIDIKLVKSKLTTKEEQMAFSEYVSFLIDHELGFMCTKSELNRFPAIDNKWDYPSCITNVLIDIKCLEHIKNINNLFASQLQQLACSNIEFRFFCNISLEEVSKIIKVFEGSSVKTIEIILPWEFENQNINYIEFLNKHRKILKLSVTNSPKSKLIKVAKDSDIFLIFTEYTIIDEKNCGIIQANRFLLNIPHYTESLAHNTCLNRKIAIDAEGNIKNCPSMKESFGNIKDTTLEEAINKPGFKKYWNIKKDDITKCKDCEFRHVCTDCRAYIDNPDDIYSAPLKCGYDPYTCEWEEWSTNPLKQKAIDYYGMREIIEK